MKIRTKLILGSFIILLSWGGVIYIFSVYLYFSLIPIILLLALICAMSLDEIYYFYTLKQLRSLHKIIIEINQGNLNKRVIVRHKDELGQLCLNFNEMVSRLQDAYLGLEKKIRERAGEIEILKTSLENRVEERTSELENLKKSLEKKMEERTQELNEKLVVLEKMNKIMINRELRMIELKKEIERLNKLLNSS